MWRRAGAGALLIALLFLLVAPAGASMALQVRGGGVDGGLPDTTNGGDAEPPTVDTVPSTSPATPATSDSTGTTETTPTTATAVTAPAVTAPAAVAPAVTAPAQQPAAADPAVATAVPNATDGPAPISSAGPDEVVVAGDDGQGAGALRPAAAGESAGAVQSPGLLLAGLAMVVGGAVALLVRSRRTPGRHYS